MIRFTLFYQVILFINHLINSIHIQASNFIPTYMYHKYLHDTNTFINACKYYRMIYMLTLIYVENEVPPSFGKILHNTPYFLSLLQLYSYTFKKNINLGLPSFKTLQRHLSYINSAPKYPIEIFKVFL